MHLLGENNQKEKRPMFVDSGTSIGRFLLIRKAIFDG